MVILVLISIVLAVAGIAVATWKKKELPESISAMAYELSPKMQYAWTAWMWGMTFPLLPVMLVKMPEPWGVVAFLWVICLMFCGAMPLADVNTRKWHYVLSITGGLLSQVCVWLICPWWLLLWTVLVVLAGILIIGYDKPWVQKIDTLLAGKGVLILEAIAMLTVWGCLL